MVKVSVIVPVFNVEKYIKECIESICNQTLRDIEIIVIDDGSEDNSIQIVKSFNDSRIKIIRKANGGLSSARNLGIRKAVGEYISFIDSDDFLGISTALEEMYSIAKQDKSDIVVGNAIKYYSQEKQYEFNRNEKNFYRRKMDSENFLINFIESYSMHSAVWLNIYRRDLIINNNIEFKEGVYHEDEDFTPRVFLNSNIVSIYPKNFYMYRSREGSIINRYDLKKAYDAIDICLNLQQILDNIKSKKLKKVMKNKTVSLVIEICCRYKNLKINKDIKKFIIKNSSNNKLKLHTILFSLSPKLYYKIRS